MTKGKPDASIVTLQPDTIAALEDIERRGLGTNTFVVHDSAGDMQIFVYKHGKVEFISPLASALTIFAEKPSGGLIELCSLVPLKEKKT